MELDAYIPSLSLQMLNMDTLVFTKLLCRFRVIWDEKYYLKLDQQDAVCEIPEDSIEKIVSEYNKDPRKLYAILNCSLQPLKLQLVDSIYPSAKVRRLGTVLETAKGYMEKEGTPNMFFDQGVLSEDLFSTAIASFYIRGNIRTSVSEESLCQGKQSFMLFLKDGKILKLDTIFNAGMFSICSIRYQESMQYLDLYQRGASSLEIYRMHSGRSNQRIQRLLSKKT